MWSSLLDLSPTDSVWHLGSSHLWDYDCPVEVARHVWGETVAFFVVIFSLSCLTRSNKVSSTPLTACYVYFLKIKRACGWWISVVVKWTTKSSRKRSLPTRYRYSRSVGQVDLINTYIQNTSFSLFLNDTMYIYTGNYMHSTDVYVRQSFVKQGERTSVSVRDDGDGSKCCDVSIRGADRRKMTYSTQTHLHTHTAVSGPNVFNWIPVSLARSVRIESIQE